jgi:hypothetical protein
LRENKHLDMGRIAHECASHVMREAMLDNVTTPTPRKKAIVVALAELAVPVQVQDCPVYSQPNL